MSGTQSIERTLQIMRLVAEKNQTGASLKEIAEMARLSKSTSHRILKALVRERFLEYQPSSQLYFLGMELFRLGSLSFEKNSISDIARPIMQKLAEMTGDTVFFSIISGHHSVCLARVEGAYPIKALTLAVGSRRPLGVGAGSLALLAALDDAQYQLAFEANMEEISQYPGYDRAALEQFVKTTRTQGFALNDGRVISGMSAIGMAVRDAQGQPVGAISIAAISQRMSGGERKRRIELLRASVLQIQKTLGIPQGQR